MSDAKLKIGEFDVESDLNIIRRKGRAVTLPPRLMRLLLFFATHPGELVTRQQIAQHCWERGCVTDQVITQSVFELRKHLGGGRVKGHSLDYIKTVQKRGYRLVAAVQWHHEVSPKSIPEHEVVSSQTSDRIEPTVEVPPAAKEEPPDVAVPAETTSASINEPKAPSEEKAEDEPSAEPEEKRRKSKLGGLLNSLWTAVSGFKKGVY